MIKKIALIKPYFPILHYSVAPPLGIMYIAAMVQKDFPNQFEVKIMDFCLDKIRFLKAAEILEEYNPDIIGCSAVSYEAEEVHNLARVIKQKMPSCLFILGGVYASISASIVLKDRNIDLTVIGEGEITMKFILSSYLQNESYNDIKGIGFVNEANEIQINEAQEQIEDLDALPFPAWNLINIEKYSKASNPNLILAGRKYMTVYSSRGCPYKCIFCHNLFGKKFRQRSAENLFEEIKLLHEKYGVDEIQFCDDIFNLNKQRVLKFCDIIKSWNGSVHLAFINGLRADIIDEQTIIELKESGTYFISYALETSSERLQKYIKKNLNINRLTETLRITNAHKIIIRLFLLIGLPTETKEELETSIKYLLKSPALLAGVYNTTPYEGTEINKMINLSNQNQNSLNHYFVNKDPNVLNSKSSRNLQRFILIKFYLSRLRFIRLFLRAPRKGLFFKRFTTIFDLLKTR